MQKPDIVINEEDFPSVFDLKKIRWTTEKAWNALFENSSFNIDFSKIAVSVGNHSTNIKKSEKGKRIDLELSVADLDTNPNKMYSLILHELYHIYDRFDPEFNFNTFSSIEGLGFTEKRRKEINALWDVYIESRKYFFLGIKPVACFSFPEKPPKTAVVENNISAFDSYTDKNKVKETMEEVWENESKITWGVLVDMVEALSNN